MFRVSKMIVRRRVGNCGKKNNMGKSKTKMRRKSFCPTFSTNQTNFLDFLIRVQKSN